MGPLDLAWHVLNLLAPAFGLGAISAALAKLVWRSDLAAVPWLRLAGWASGASAAALIGGLALTGHDGRMGTYAAMVLSCAAALGWAGFASRRR